MHKFLQTIVAGAFGAGAMLIWQTHLWVVNQIILSGLCAVFALGLMADVVDNHVAFGTDIFDEAD